MDDEPGIRDLVGSYLRDDGYEVVEAVDGEDALARTGCDGSMAFVDVIDTGPGVAAEELERIFERFYRGAPGRSPHAGRGIGLTIARSLARAHGGDVVVAATGSESGATFRLTVPTGSACEGVDTVQILD